MSSTDVKTVGRQTENIEPELMAVPDCENLYERMASNEMRLPDQTSADWAYRVAECLPRSTHIEQLSLDACN